MHKEIVEIEQVLYCCCHAVDQGDIDKIISFFHPDADLIIKWEEDGIHSGYDAIRNWFVNYTQIIQSSMKYLRHKITCPMIEVCGNEATAFSYLDVDTATKDTNQVIITVGRYEDKLVKMDGCWYLKEKVIFVDDTYNLSK
ncbi:MAG: nuclear transport factor 2 family protein [Candidatus Saganbacteria bacterium]|nr:nuclear transport factor 2 family protein [Candidatus Saganbacteria bacterium]